MSHPAEEIPIRTLDDNADQWFADLYEAETGDEAYRQAEASVALALGYDLEDMTDVDVEDLSAVMGSLSVFSALNALGSERYDGEAEDEFHLRRTARGVVRDILALAWNDHAHETELEAGYFDTMTGALNERGRNRHLRRRYGLDARRGEARPVRERAGDVAVAEVAEGDDDLTNFKRINDMLGDHIGDEAIREAYDELLETLRFADDVMIARYRRGDEFEILLGNISEADLADLEGRMLQAQLAKVQNGKYVAIWKKIYARKVQLEKRQRDLKQVSEVRLDDINGAPTRMLYIDGRRVCPLRDIVVHSFAFEYGPLGSWEDHASLQGRAQSSNKARKGMLHAMMGGKDRPE